MRRACEKFDEKKPPHVLMGRFCSVANYICFLIAGNHPYKNVSTFPFGVDYIVEKIFGSISNRVLSAVRITTKLSSVMTCGLVAA